MLNKLAPELTQIDKAVSIGQPWATLVCGGIIGAFRMRQTYHYRGPIAIHASTITPTEAEDQFCKQPDIAHRLTKQGYRGFREEWGVGTLLLPRGVIMGTAELIDIKPAGGGDYTWVFQNAKKLSEPVAARGAFGIFDLRRATESMKPRSKPVRKRYKR